jgi:ATP-dependent RNA helicase DeaD
MTETPGGPSGGFSSLGLAPALVAAVTALGYEEPTPIQREAIPVLLAGRDLVGQAGTGTGKTAAFALPMLDRLAKASASRSANRGARGLVLVPTRELAMQVAEAIHKYAKGLNLTVSPLYGGASMDQQVRALRRGADVIVATPGRALDHLRRKTLDLGALEVLVLDEADEMLDMGFAEDLEAIVGATPATRQTALFAATMAPRIASIAGRHLKDPSRVTIAREKRAPGKLPRVRQSAYIVSRANKTAALSRVLEFEDPKSAIVFCRTRLEVDELTDTLDAHGYGAKALHGGMEQRERDRVMQLFRQEKLDVLVATDVAARGLDIEHVSHVINYDMPPTPEDYVHRIGRTGRIGREGVAITLTDPREQRFLRSIEAFTKQPIGILTLPTVADLRARRLDATRASVRDRIVAGGLDDVRAIVTSLAQEFDVLDVAAAAVRLIHDASDAASAPELPVVAEAQVRPVPRTHAPARVLRGHGDRREAPRGSTPPRDRDPGEAPARLYIRAGKNVGMRPGDLVGAITGEAGVPSRVLGAIRIADDHSTIDVPQALATRIMAALRATTIRGNKVEVRRDRGKG